MAIVSYRIYCDGCQAETIIRKDQVDKSGWTVNSLTHHEGTCPQCSKKKPHKVDETDVVVEEKDLGKLSGIGATVESRLNDKGIMKPSDAGKFSDEQLKRIKGVGQGVVNSIRNASK